MITALAAALAGLVAPSNATPERQLSDSSRIVAIVSEFHAALASGDSATALRHLDQDAIVLEGGDVETREEYRAHHLAADIEYARGVPSKRTVVRVTVAGDAGWIVSTSDNRGRMGTRTINSVSAELIVLRKRATGWKIAAIHWSSRSRPQNSADRIRQLDSAWARSYAVHDTALARSLFAEDIVITSTNGTLKTREEEIADVRPAAGLVMDYFRTRTPQVRVFAEQSAVVTGLAEWSFQFNGKANALRRRYTSVFVPGGPLGWKMVALHIGRAPDP